MPFLELDIRTFLRLLTIGNVVAMIMVYAYKTHGDHRVPIRLFVWSRFFQALGFGLISLRGEIPVWVSAHIGNPMIFAGFAFEIAALGRMSRYNQGAEKLLAIWVVGGSLVFWGFGNTPSMLVVVSSFVVGLIYGTGGLALWSHLRSSRLQILTLGVVLAFGPILMVRGYIAAAESISAMTTHVMQSFAYLTQFSLLLVSTVGFLLLMKEADDLRLVESENRERERRLVQSRFMDMLTHELRSALSVIKVSGSSLSHYLAGQAPEVNQRLTSIQQAAGSMSRIVERCIQLDQLDQSAQPIRRVACTADDIIDEVADTHDAQRNRLDIRDSASETLMADPDLLRVMLDNLVDNALKYATPGTTVTIAVATETRNKRPAVRFTVENQVAPGTAPPTGEMFVRYFRGAHSHEFSGTGLGLCLVRELARLQGGDADYQGTPSGQVRISFWLPSEMTTNPST